MKLTAELINQAYVIATPDAWHHENELSQAALVKYTVMADWLNGQLTNDRATSATVATGDTYEPLSQALVSYIRQSTLDALEGYAKQRQIGRDTAVDVILSSYLGGQASGELAHLRATVEMLQSQITELLGTHDQP